MLMLRWPSSPRSWNGAQQAESAHLFLGWRRDSWEAGLEAGSLGLLLVQKSWQLAWRLLAGGRFGAFLWIRLAV